MDATQGAGHSLVAVVTGGGTGFGRAISLSLARRGVAVAIGYSRSKREAVETLAEVRALGVVGMIFHADIANDHAVTTAFDEIDATFGRIDVLVNNAGATTFVPLDDLEALEDEHWDQALGVNLKGTFHCCRAAARVMKREGTGSIVNVASVAGIVGRGSSIPYCASKAGVLALTRSLAQVLSPTIRVNAVAPGVANSRWTADQEEFRISAANATPLGRIAEPEDVAAVVVPLALDFKHVTGQVLTVDGGITL